MIPPRDGRLDVHDRLRHLFYVVLGFAIVLALLLTLAQATGWPRLTLESEVRIEAAPAVVWAILADLDSYPEWNPFITRAAGVLGPGNRLDVRIEPPGGMPMSFRPRIIDLEPEARLAWRGRMLAPGVFDGEHAFTLSSQGAGATRFTQAETFRGILVPLFAGSLGGTVRRGFDAMNEALKRRAETAGGTAPEVAPEPNVSSSPGPPGPGSSRSGRSPSR